MRNGATEQLTLGEDANISLRVDPAPSVDAPLVFVGYGLRIPERGIDDFTGLTLSGAVVVYISATPTSLPGPLQAHFGSADERWKMYSAAGAIGTISIANPKSMDIPWARSTLARLQPAMALADRGADDAPGQQIAVTMNPAHADKLLAGSGHTFAELLGAGRRRQAAAKLRAAGAPEGHDAGRARDVESQNVAGLLRGSDPPRREEYVVLSAHLDHLGIGGAINGDTIYNGAMDNASGVAAILDVAATLHDVARSRRDRSCSWRSPAKKRASSGRATSPRIPPCRATRIVANVNTDMFLPLFPLKTLMVLGLDESDLGQDVRATAKAARYWRAGRSRTAAQPVRPQRSVQLHQVRHPGAGDESRLRAEFTGSGDRGEMDQRAISRAVRRSESTDRSFRGREVRVGSHRPVAADRKPRQPAALERVELLQAVR